MQLGLITLIVGCGQNTTSETETQETNKAVLVKTIVVKPEKYQAIDFTASLARGEVHMQSHHPEESRKSMLILATMFQKVRFWL